MSLHFAFTMDALFDWNTPVIDHNIHDKNILIDAAPIVMYSYVQDVMPVNLNNIPHLRF